MRWTEPVTLFDRLVDDAAMFPPGNASPADAVAAHRRHRRSAYADVVGPLVVPDHRLAEVGRLAGPDPLEVSVIVPTGAGGVAALAGRHVPGVEIVAVETALRDPGGLVANAARVVAAATALPDDVPLFVEVPDTPGWRDAFAAVEAAGHFGKIRTGGPTADLYPSPGRLAAVLSALVELDLAFKATAGLHRAWPTTVPGPDGGPLRQHGFVAVMVALDALIDGADEAAAADLLADPSTDPLRAVVEWSAERGARVRRRFRSFGCCGVEDPVADLVELGLLTLT